MCGIAGEIQFNSDGLNRSDIKPMVESLTHRGPDEQRYYEYTNRTGDDGRDITQVNLGMCRLSIIDREHGQQPFGDTCKAFFNGEIYNHKLVRRRIERQADDLYTNCDSEVVAAAYECWENEFIRELDGMYAIAIWDERQEKLKLFRDPIGKKPLYYYCKDGVFLFASEIKAIVQHPVFEKKINEHGIWQFMCLQYVPEPETAYEGIYCVPPGGQVTYTPATGELRVSGSPLAKPEPLGDDVDYDALTKTVRHTVIGAVNKRLESEVPLGVYLSGGIDSAIITAVAAEQTKDLHTFTMGFLNPQYDERPLAVLMAERYKTYHMEKTVESVDLAEMAGRIVRQYDQPFGDCSAIPTMLLAELSKKYITVALSGDGGDEAFGGYPRYWMAPNITSEYWKFMSIWPVTRRQHLWPGGAEKYSQSNPWDVTNPPIDQYNGSRTGAMYSDMLTYLPNDIIVKMERATMATSVEARCPFLDPSVLSLGLSIPEDYKIRQGEGKLILKDAFRDMLPDEILNAPKRGFSVPMNEWLRDPNGAKLLSDTILHPGAFAELEGFDRNVMAQLTMAHMNKQVDIGHALWIMIMLEMWLQENFR